MTTAAFQGFLEQFNSKGRSHGEGYVGSHFDGLSEVERAQVEEMLMGAALNGDATAVSGLRLLGGERALDALSKVAQAAGPRSIAGIQAIAALLASRRSSTDLGVLLDTIVTGDQSVSWIALQTFPGSAAFGAEDRAAIVAALSKYIVAEPDIIRRNVAAKKLLRVLDVHESDPEYKDHVRQLSNDSRKVRKILLDKLRSRIR
jgi:hypothetical protein